MHQVIGLYNDEQKEIIRCALLRSFGTENPLNFAAKRLMFGAKSLEEGIGSFSRHAAQDLDPAQYSIRFKSGEHRFFERYDFEKEWNNSGYGRIGFGPGAFDVSDFIQIKTSDYESLAEIVHLPTGDVVSDYLGLIRSSDQLSLWCLRPVGPADGFDWKFVEEFVSQREVSEFGGSPTLSGLPYGFSSGFMMRIDCDEAILSGRRLAQLYWDRGLVFSIAVKTNQKIGFEEQAFFAEILQKGGSVLPHSHTHLQDWGYPSGNLETELNECVKCLAAGGIPQEDLSFVVSPFHQNSRKAVEGIAARGAEGFIGGIICNDPEYLCARPGVVPFQKDQIITLSQQCMLHGDCYRKNGRTLEIEKAAFVEAASARQFFGYLDHPFSSYSYGWDNEEERLQVHTEFLNFLLGFENQWRPNLGQAMRFFQKRSQVRIQKFGPAQFEVVQSAPVKTNKADRLTQPELTVALEFQSQVQALKK